MQSCWMALRIFFLHHNSMAQDCEKFSHDLPRRRQSRDGSQIQACCPGPPGLTSTTAHTDTHTSVLHQLCTSLVAVCVPNTNEPHHGLRHVKGSVALLRPLTNYHTSSCAGKCTPPAQLFNRVYLHKRGPCHGLTCRACRSEVARLGLGPLCAPAWPSSSSPSEAMVRGYAPGEPASYL